MIKLADLFAEAKALDNDALLEAMRESLARDGCDDAFRAGFLRGETLKRGLALSAADLELEAAAQQRLDTLHKGAST